MTETDTAWHAALIMRGLNPAVATQVIDLIHSCEPLHFGHEQSEFSMSLSLDDLILHPDAQVGDLRRHISDAHALTPLYVLLRAVPSLKFARGQYFVDWSYLLKANPEPDHVGICESLFYSSEITGRAAIETLRYAATLVRHLLLHLYDHITMSPEEAIRYGLFNPGDNSYFDELWEKLAVTAGGKLSHALGRIRWVNRMLLLRCELIRALLLRAGTPLSSRSKAARSPIWRTSCPF
jgi:hypothetical protein